MKVATPFMMWCAHSGLAFYAAYGGGGVHTAEDFRTFAGRADKVSVNSSAVKDPDL